MHAGFYHISSYLSIDLNPPKKQNKTKIRMEGHMKSNSWATVSVYYFMHFFLDTDKTKHAYGNI